jgi:hypothetical protein
MTIDPILRVHGAAMGQAPGRHRIQLESEPAVGRWGFQFRLWHLGLFVLTSALIFSEFHSPPARRPSDLGFLLWVSMGIIWGHIVAAKLLAAIDRDRSK